MHKNVWILTIAQALMMSLNSLNVFVGGLVGTKLAPSEKLATIPVASIVVGTALSTVPVTMIMKRIGRKKTFLLISVYSIIVSILAGYAIMMESFYLFSFCTFLLGLTSACLMQFRFAAMESVNEDQIPKAASYVLLGGIAAAFMGPEVAVLGKDLFTSEFMGSYLLLGGLFLLSLFVLLTYENTVFKTNESDLPQRTLKEISSQGVFWVAVLGATVGYAVMTFIMTATPVSMHLMDGHSLSDTKWVIQSHIVAMFLPSIFTGWLIKKFGIIRMMIIGLFIYLFCIATAYSGHFLHHYWVSLVLLGLGWNFLFVGGTALLPQSYTPSERFKVQGMNELIIFATQAVASLSSGWIVFTLGWENLLMMTLPVILIQFITIWLWQAKKRKVAA
ncbi:MFS transporter [Marinoscillum sp. MHG1-6]|uniref:MFS transporter n=1 Tax=Marinoscillum sp. MHG1-6 TaxID=2959627 RepID=UPI0021579724|nr:MFS transporter [Marinoscillum sp. MHG1-6]